MLVFFLIYLTLINLVTFYRYWEDKDTARKKHAWRTPERLLLFYALMGGTPAAFFACHHFRHKTSKKSFKIRLQLIAAAQIAAIIIIAYEAI